MRRLGLLATSLVGLALVGTAWAGPYLHINRGAISSKQCTSGGGSARVVVDVTYTLDNYSDAGFAGAWALDHVNRHLTIWKRSSGTFCAQIVDDGSKFVTLSAFSPAAHSYIPAGIEGTFDGGYIIAGINGKLITPYKTSGALGTFDAKCNQFLECKGSYPSWSSYFKGATQGGFLHWGWLYTTDHHGTWIDQDDIQAVFSGDIQR